MTTEEIKVNDRKTLVLHINPTTNKVHRVDVHTPDYFVAKNTYLEPYGISKQEAIQEYSK
jgi:hypothetical protein